MNHFIGVATLAVALVALGTTAAFAHTSQTQERDVTDYADPVLFDGEVNTDCSVVGTDMILWELTGSNGVTYAELHVDQPEASVTTRTAAPYIWVTPRYAMDLIDADVDRIVGDIDPSARLIATICDVADTNDTNTATPLLPVATGIAGAALGMIAGRRLTGSRKTS
ncbi:MAG: hypothetical protein WD360_06125 [Nitriliruptoraceae bacterium]